MALEISPGVFAAFEAEAAKQEVDQFRQWWNARSAWLGAPLTLDDARRRLEAARAEGREIGVNDNDDNRLFIEAAAMRLLPSPTGEQWLLATDIVFMPEDDDARVARLVALAQAPR